MMVTDETIAKAKRRIKRFVKTGEKQARVRPVSENRFAYHAKHHHTILLFKRDILGRLRLVK
jgi:hypothetical protein